MATRAVVLFVAAFVASACQGVGAALCPTANVEPLIDGLVLAASPDPGDPFEPAPALVVAPNCEVTPLALELDEEYIDPDIPVETMPPDSDWAGQTAEPDAVFVLVLWVRDHVIARVQSCRAMYVTEANLKSVKSVQWPLQLKQLYLSSNQLTTAAIAYPEFLRTLDLSGNPITALEHVDFPTELRALSLPAIISIKNVTWSHALESLTIETSTISSLELRKSDFTAISPLLGKIKAKSTQTTCADPTATLETGGLN